MTNNEHQTIEEYEAAVEKSRRKSARYIDSLEWMLENLGCISEPSPYSLWIVFHKKFYDKGYFRYDE